MMRPAVFKHPPMLSVRIRSAEPADLDRINHIIENAVMTWPLLERVKRLSLPSYRYRVEEMAHLHMHVAERETGEIVGVATLEPVASHAAPAEQNGVLLHGLYVDPAYQGRGVGTQLLDAVRQAAQRTGVAGVLVRAQRHAVGFFVRSGFEPAGTDQAMQTYPFQYWQPVQARNPV